MNEKKNFGWSKWYKCIQETNMPKDDQLCVEYLEDKTA